MGAAVLQQNFIDKDKAMDLARCGPMWPSPEVELSLFQSFFCFSLDEA